jgi:ABC-type glycerol-3-phosphate transport system permease component
MVPLPGPVIAEVIILTFLNVWSDLLQHLPITASKSIATLPVSFIKNLTLIS